MLPWNTCISQTEITGVRENMGGRCFCYMRAQSTRLMVLCSSKEESFAPI